MRENIDTLLGKIDFMGIFGVKTKSIFGEKTHWIVKKQGDKDRITLERHGQKSQKRGLYYRGNLTENFKIFTHRKSNF